tara:strand:- start:67434 stop:68510 length:1077 start_codon:yes stop_codon:yes gene_type:complete
MKKSPSRAKIDLSKPKIDILCQKLSERVEEILDFFGIEYEQYDNRIAAACPIHDGDKTDALTIFTSGDNVVGNWYCWTNHCEKEYVNTMLGFIRGVMSQRADREVSFIEAVNFACELVEIDLDNVKVDREHIEKTAFVACASNLLKKSKPTPKGISRDVVRQGLQRPVDFYLKRGFLEETLDTFDVGICINSNKLMYNRVVVPVYDDSHQYMVGCVGRSLEDNPSTQKWINSKGFNSGAHLYNYWMAKKEISRTETIVLVEGQGDVWRLWEAGIRNAVGMFGCHLTDYQQISIEKSGAMNIVVLTDNDEAGIKAASSIKEKCGRLFNLHFPQLPKKDVGDMSTDEIEEQLKPQIASIL